MTHFIAYLAGIFSVLLCQHIGRKFDQLMQDVNQDFKP